MKNVTITLNEKVARWARIWATQHDTTISRLIGDLLHERMQQEEGYGVAMERYLGRQPANLSDSQAYPTRDELYG